MPGKPKNDYRQPLKREILTAVVSHDYKVRVRERSRLYPVR